MYEKLICVLMIFSSDICVCMVSILDKTELVLAFMTHRHGDRTPVQEEMKFAIDPARVMELSLKYGFGQLTDKGKTRGYELGKFIRHRYGGALSDQYNRSEIFIRSTDSTRTKMTVLTAMAAVYPPVKDNWNEDIKWTPVPYTTVRVKYDSMLPILNCPVIVNSFKNKLKEPIPSMVKYKPLLNQLSDIFGIDLSQEPASLSLINDMFASQLSLGVPLTPSLDNLLPEIEEGASEAIEFLYGDEKYLALQAGVILKDFFDAVESILCGKDVPRIHVYSGHDINVFTFSAVAKVRPRLGVPKYGSVFILELRRLPDGRYIVVPVYLEQPGADAEILRVEGCDEGFCDLGRFRVQTSQYVRNEIEWRMECGFSEDFVFDTSAIY